MALDNAELTDDTATIRESLHSVDWSFVDRERAHSLDSIHPYPAKFISEVPRALIETLPCPDGTSIFDPFAGSGTTLTEAQRLGYPSVGIDLNPIACLISRVKTSPIQEDLPARAAAIVEAASIANVDHTNEIPNVDHWFKKDIQVAIAELLYELKQLDDPFTYDALSLALSSILVRVSNQESDTRYAAIEKNVSRNDVFDYFLSAAKKLYSALNDRNWPFAPARVIEANTLSITPEELEVKAGLVVTSPPYPNAYEYWLYHKYRMWWLGFDPLAVKRQEIGARAHFFKKDPHTEEHFWTQMRTTFALLDKTLVAKGFACFVIGRSKIHGKVINNADIIQTTAIECGFELITRIERPIAQNRKSFNLSHANIKTETIVVLRKL